MGGACLDCKTHKYGCNHTGKKNLAMIWVVRPVGVQELLKEKLKELEEVVEEGKERKHPPDSPVPSKKAKMKQVKVKVEKPKPKLRPKPTEKKGKSKWGTAMRRMKMPWQWMTMPVMRGS